MENDPKPENANRRQEDISVDEILRRIDVLPKIDKRSPDEIIGYDKDGIPAQNSASPASPVPDQTENGFDFEAYNQEILRNPKAREVIEFFLKYRHREWESRAA